jgi:hypothetical protein
MWHAIPDIDKWGIYRCWRAKKKWSNFGFPAIVALYGQTGNSRIPCIKRKVFRTRLVEIKASPLIN